MISHWVSDISLGISYICAGANLFMIFRRNKGFDDLRKLTDSVIDVNNIFAESLRTIARNRGAVNPQMEASDALAQGYNKLHHYARKLPEKKESKSERASSGKK